MKAEEYKQTVAYGILDIKDLSRQVLANGCDMDDKAMLIATIHDHKVNAAAAGDKDNIARILAEIAGQLDLKQAIVLSRILDKIIEDKME